MKSHSVLWILHSCFIKIKFYLSIYLSIYQEVENSTSFCALCKALVHCPTVHVALVSVQSFVFSTEGDKTLANLSWLNFSLKFNQGLIFGIHLLLMNSVIYTSDLYC